MIILNAKPTLGFNRLYTLLVIPLTLIDHSIASLAIPYSYHHSLLVPYSFYIIVVQQLGSVSVQFAGNLLCSGIVSVSSKTIMNDLEEESRCGIAWTVQTLS